MSWKDIPIPPRMEKLPRIYPGFPVPYVIMKDDAGVYNLKVNDEKRVLRCLELRLCAICGQLMGKDMWLVGGPLSALHENGAYKDTPMHYTCMEYALKVCPYLAARHYNTIDPFTDKKLLKNAENLKEGTLLYNPTQNMDRPKVFIAIHLPDFTTSPYGPSQVVHPKRPYLNMQFWRHGEQINFEKAKEMIGEYED